MKAAVLEELGKIVVHEVPDPQIDDHSALLKVEAVAVCGSDIRIFRHGNPRVKPPAIIGHEIAGTIVAAGKAVTRVKVGQRVAVGADVPCGQCAWCRNGLGNNCTINYAVGYQIPGGFAEYMKLPALVLEGGPGHALCPVAGLRHGCPGRTAGLRHQRAGTGQFVAGQDMWCWWAWARSAA